MKLILSILLIICTQSCKLSYRVVDSNEVYEGNILIKEERRLKGDMKPISKTTTTKTDTLTQQVIYREVVIRDCKGAYSIVIKKTEWELIEGELIKTTYKD